MLHDPFAEACPHELVGDDKTELPVGPQELFTAFDEINQQVGGASEGLVVFFQVQFQV